MVSKSYSKGISWINDCRIPFVDDGDIKSQERAFSKNSSSHKGQAWNNHLGWESSSKGGANDTHTQGRFPANILVCDDMLNDGIVNGGGGYSGIKKRKRINHFTERGEQYGKAESPDNYGDKGSNSRYYDIDKWFNNLIDG